MCSGYEECVFDYFVTGRKTLALASADAIKQHTLFVEATKKGESLNYNHSRAPGFRSYAKTRSKC